REVSPINERQFEVNAGEAEVLFEVDDRQEVNALVYKRNQSVISGTRMDFVMQDQFYRLKLPEEVLDRFVGRYRVGNAPDAADMVITREETQLLIQEGGNPAVEIFPISESVFEWKLLPAQIHFVENTDGRVMGMRIERETTTISAIKR
ncbi:MAG TPA: hypothetical protein PLL64_08535, partial [Rhodothermales bacterium]|nr:hypothetical protein [Rhodothermales bacterium]